MALPRITNLKVTQRVSPYYSFLQPWKNNGQDVPYTFPYRYIIQWKLSTQSWADAVNNKLTIKPNNADHFVPFTERFQFGPGLGLESYDFRILSLMSDDPATRSEWSNVATRGELFDVTTAQFKKKIEDMSAGKLNDSNTTLIEEAPDNDWKILYKQRIFTLTDTTNGKSRKFRISEDALEDPDILISESKRLGLKVT